MITLELTPYDSLLVNLDKDGNISSFNSDVSLLQRADVISMLPQSLNSLVDNINPKYIRALDVLNELLTIAQAWNKEDNFVPDFRKQFQLKWFPCFKYYDSPVYMMYSDVNYYTNNAPDVYIGQRFCFKTAKRAEQFGKKFIHLFRELFMS